MRHKQDCRQMHCITFPLPLASVNPKRFIYCWWEKAALEQLSVLINFFVFLSLNSNAMSKHTLSLLISLLPGQC